MNRRTYIYSALPLFVLLSCGQLLSACLGALGALIVASVAIIIAWGVVWVRMYSIKLRPEMAVLSILPHAIYFVSRYADTAIFQQSPAWQNLYALTWLGFAGAMIATMRPQPPTTWGKDPVCWLMIPLIIFYTISTFYKYYTTLAALS